MDNLDLSGLIDAMAKLREAFIEKLEEPLATIIAELNYRGLIGISPPSMITDPLDNHPFVLVILDPSSTFPRIVAGYYPVTGEFNVCCTGKLPLELIN
jgi:hypothetical protein